MAPAHSVWGVDGVSLVESSTNGPAARGSCLSTTHGLELRLGWWVWNLVRRRGRWMVFGTLLGPEESGARPGWGWFRRMGLLLFDCWIVDASIARTEDLCQVDEVCRRWWGFRMCGCLFL